MGSQFVLPGGPRERLALRPPSRSLGQYGIEVEKALSPEIEDRSRSKPRRKLALSGLRSLAERYPARRLAIVNRLAVLLAASTKEEANFNGCIVFVLERLEAVEVKEVIEAAFEQKKVDPHVFKQSSLEL